MRSFKPESVPPPKNLQPPLLLKPGVDIEIGPGVGLHPIQYCREFKDRTLIAIERTKVRYEKLARRKLNHDLNNLIVINDDAVNWITYHIQPATVTNIFLLYPNPYPKGAQANKRWHRMPFFNFLIDSLEQGGRVHYATNEQFYRDEAVEFINYYPELKLEKDKELLGEQEKYLTHFEKKYLTRGETCYHLTWVKKCDQKLK